MGVLQHGRANLNENRTELAELLCTCDSLECGRFTNSGPETTLLTIRVARTFTGKAYMVQIEGACHGAHNLVCARVVPAAGTTGPADAPSRFQRERDWLTPY